MNNKIFLGTSNVNSHIYWDLNNSNLNNRHVLTTGTSGQGKTFAFTRFAEQFISLGIPVLIMDTSNSYPDSIFQSKVTTLEIYNKGIVTNPFIPNRIMSNGTITPEESHDTALRFTEQLKDTFELSDTQYATAYKASKKVILASAISDNQIPADFYSFTKALSNSSGRSALALHNKLMPLIDSNLLTSDPNFTWEGILESPAKITVFSFNNIVPTYQQLLLKLLLWDLWYFGIEHRTVHTPFVVIFDECQHLDYSANSPISKILTEGRKFGWSGWFSTQFLDSQFSPTAIRKLQQAGLKLYFKPTDNDIPLLAKQLTSTQFNPSKEEISKLRRGSCIAQGHFTDGSNNHFSLLSIYLNILSGNADTTQGGQVL